MATAEFSKFAGILSAALSQHHLSGFEINSGLEDLNSLMPFREGFFKAIICDEGCRVHDFLLTGWW